jgi:hypothetical protein
VAKPSPEEILADPASFNVDDVTAALATATPEQAEQAKALEAAGKQRVTILEYTPPEPEPEEPRYPRSRILDPTEGPQIVGHVEALGRTATLPDIVGGLEGVDGEMFTRYEVRDHITSWLTRPLEA